MSLSSRLDEAEKYGLDRSVFPLEHRGHRLVLLINDGHDTNDGRVLLHISMMCSRCNRHHTVRGRAPYGEETPNKIAAAKLAAFGPYTEDCPM